MTIQRTSSGSWLTACKRAWALLCCTYQTTKLLPHLTQQDPEDDGTDFLLKDDGDDIDLRLARLEALTARCVQLGSPACASALLAFILLRQQTPLPCTHFSLNVCHTHSRRPELLSAVMLRQNPHNVAEWHKRVKLFEGHPTKQVRGVLSADQGSARGLVGA